MTEDQWLKANSPKPMLKFIRLKTTARTINQSLERKLRLFACASVRRLSLIARDERLWKAVNEVEQAVETENPEDLLRACHQQIATVEPPDEADPASGCWRCCRDAVQFLSSPQTNGEVKRAIEMAKIAAGCDAWLSAQPAGQPKIHAGTASDPKIKPLKAALDRAWAIEREAQARLLRDVIGPFPFRAVALQPQWVTSTVKQLADAIYEQRAFDRLPFLADALQDGGCDNDEILKHCRLPGVHVRGCWTLDLILAKK